MVGNTMKPTPLFVVAGFAAGILTGWAVAGDEYARVTAAPRAAGEMAAGPLTAIPSVTRIATNRTAVGALRAPGLHR
jgi:hypothetical protein